MTTAERLIEARTQARLSVVTVSDKCGISAEALTAYETGKRIPRDSVKAALADLYQIPIPQLFFW